MFYSAPPIMFARMGAGPEPVNLSFGIDIPPVNMSLAQTEKDNNPYNDAKPTTAPELTKKLIVSVAAAAAIIAFVPTILNYVFPKGKR